VLSFLLLLKIRITKIYVHNEKLYLLSLDVQIAGGQMFIFFSSAQSLGFPLLHLSHSKSLKLSFFTTKTQTLDPPPHNTLFCLQGRNKFKVQNSHQRWQQLQKFAPNWARETI